MLKLLSGTSIAVNALKLITFMKIRITQIITPSIPLAILLVASCFLLWISAFFDAHNTVLTFHQTLPVQYIQTLLQPNSLFSNLISFGLVLFNAFLLAQLNNKYTFIRTRTFLPILIFLLLLSSWQETHITNGSHITLTLIIVSLFYIFDMHRNRMAVEQAFMSTFFISLSSIIINPLIFLIPAFWIGFLQLKCLSFKTFTASLFGTITPWIFYFSIALYFQPSIHVLDFIQQNTISPLDIESLKLSNIIYIGALAISVIITLVGMFSLYNRDAIHTRNKLSFLLILLITVCAISLIFHNQVVSFFPLIALCIAILTSHPFTLKQNNFYSLLFIIFVIINIAHIISNHFI